MAHEVDPPLIRRRPPASEGAAEAAMGGRASDAANAAGGLARLRLAAALQNQDASQERVRAASQEVEEADTRELAAGIRQWLAVRTRPPAAPERGSVPRPREESLWKS